MSRSAADHGPDENSGTRHVSAGSDQAAVGGCKRQPLSHGRIEIVLPTPNALEKLIQMGLGLIGRATALAAKWANRLKKMMFGFLCPIV